jgi:hypothetical protein
MVSPFVTDTYRIARKQLIKEQKFSKKKKSEIIANCSLESGRRSVLFHTLKHLISTQITDQKLLYHLQSAERATISSSRLDLNFKFERFSPFLTHFRQVA